MESPKAREKRHSKKHKRNPTENEDGLIEDLHDYYSQKSSKQLRLDEDSANSVINSRDVENTDTHKRSKRHGKHHRSIDFENSGKQKKFSDNEEAHETSSKYSGHHRNDEISNRHKIDKEPNTEKYCKRRRQEPEGEDPKKFTRRRRQREDEEYGEKYMATRREGYGRSKKHSRMEEEESENLEPHEYPRYWDRKDKGEEDIKEEEYVQPSQSYWGDRVGRERNKRISDRGDKFDDDKYLVGSRYYVDSRKNKKVSPRTANREERINMANDDVKEQPPAPPPPKKTTDIITSRTGGAYIPPAKLKLMQASITDKSSAEYQRIAWEALKKSIHGHINKVNTSNIGVVARLLFKENIIRGRGLLCRSIIQAQSVSVTFTNVYACLVAIINSKFPNIGELLLKRVIIRFKRAYKRNDKAVCISSATFIAHLINQRVAHEILGLELVTLLVENPTDDSIEVAVAFLKEAGQKLSEVTSKGTNAIFDMLRNILHEGKLEKRVQYMIEVMFQVRKDDFASFPAVPEELDLVDEEDQFTHLIGLDDAIVTQDILDVFKLDTEYQANEDKYKELRTEILDTDSEGSGSGFEDSSSGEEESGDEDEEGEDDEKKMTIIDNTETNLVAFRKTIYLTIQSSLDFEECAHKLLKMEIKPGQEKELCHMFLDCCAEQRTYEKFFGLLAQRFCQVNKIYIAPFEEIFADTYATVHRLDTNRLRNVAKLFAHLLFTDAISWAVLATIKLNEEDTTSSSRIFIKILFQELSEYMGLSNLNARVKDPTLQSSMEGLFPRDNPKDTRFAINFFTSIGLGGLTDELREHLKNLPRPVPVSQLIQDLSSATSSSSSSEESSSESEESSSSSSTSSDEEEDVRKRKPKTFSQDKKSQKDRGPTEREKVNHKSSNINDKENQIRSHIKGKEQKTRSHGGNENSHKRPYNKENQIKSHARDKEHYKRSLDEGNENENRFHDKENHTKSHAKGRDYNEQHRNSHGGDKEFKKRSHDTGKQYKKRPHDEVKEYKKRSHDEVKKEECKKRPHYNERENQRSHEKDRENHRSHDKHKESQKRSLIKGDGKLHK